MYQYVDYELNHLCFGLCSVIGAVVIVIGFYGVMWAQWNGENSETREVDSLQPSSKKTSLLETHATVWILLNIVVEFILNDAS